MWTPFSSSTHLSQPRSRFSPTKIPLVISRGGAPPGESENDWQGEAIGRDCTPGNPLPAICCFFPKWLVQSALRTSNSPRLRKKQLSLRGFRRQAGWVCWTRSKTRSLSWKAWTYRHDPIRISLRFTKPPWNRWSLWRELCKTAVIH